MRDPNRIGPILAELAEVWAKNRDLRLGQLVCNAAAHATENRFAVLFYMEDDVLLEGLRALNARPEDQPPTPGSSGTKSPREGG